MADKPLTFWFCGGDLIWRGDGRPQPISLTQAEMLLTLFQDEHDAALRRPANRVLARAIRGLFLELTDAMAEHAKWLRVVRGDTSNVVTMPSRRHGAQAVA